MDQLVGDARAERGSGTALERIDVPDDVEDLIGEEREAWHSQISEAARLPSYW